MALGDPMGVVMLWSSSEQVSFNEYDIPPGQCSPIGFVVAVTAHHLLGLNVFKSFWQLI